MPTKTAAPKPGFEDLRKKGLQAYWVIRKVIQLMDRISHKGVDGVQAFSAAKSLAEIEKAVADNSIAHFEKDMRGWIAETHRQIKATQEEFKSWFGGELEKRFKEIGLKLQGNFPELRAGAFNIRCDLEAGTVKITFGADEDSIAVVDPDPDDVVKAIQNTLREFEGLRLPDDRFVEQIRAAYDRCLKLSGLRTGEKVGILDVLKEFVWLIQSKRFTADPKRENFRSYPRTAFSYNLSKLESRGGLELTVAAREQASRREEHLWVPTDDRGNGTHFASISFK
jgi:hypothetical protein